MPDFNPSDLANWCSGEWTKLPEAKIMDSRSILVILVKESCSWQ